ncbi:hypothetical protein [Aliikangiella coralliicola]|uniref:Curli production assembly/transport component CsgG n=1 Tax=Aliikangiella coralliicola TaxID=2592383 RepID=A0A545U4Y2_9GAMM|nr:hypothetical protein [Aliikangiella coralliicola]TQV84528.1 hypothetical protein FLL46_23230 [Aliikangiella coralliicola]
MQNKLISLITASFLCLLLACGGANKALISQAEIDAARHGGSLENLYDKASGFVAESKGSARKDAVELRSKIAQLLVVDKGQQVESVLSKLTEDNTSITRQQLLQTQQSIEGMQQWSATDYTRLNTKLARAIESLNQKIKRFVDESKESGKDQVASVLALKKAATLAGKEQPETKMYQQTHEKVISQLLYQGNDGLSKRLFSTVVSAAKSGLLLDPGSIQFESMLSQGQAGLFEKDFRFALENGKPESAYQSLLQVADEPIFLQLKKSMGTSIPVLATYFAGAAKKAYEKGDLLTAYQNFQKGRTVQEKLDVSQKGFIQEKRFLDLVMSRARQEQSGDGKRQALMRVVNEFDPNYPGLKAEFLKLSDEVKNRAMTKLSVAEFKEVQSGDSVVASVGRRVGSKLEKILFEQLGNEVLIVTDTPNSTAQNYQGLLLKVDGEILQAAIETSVNNGQRSQQVQTGINRVETEEYKKWAKRKRGEAPKQYNESPIVEEVVLRVEHVRKQAIAEVAFRIIEPSTGKILLTDNFVKEAEHAGESINEYQKGDFHQPYVRADLPSDIKIMDSLATELAAMLGEKLSNYLRSPEQVFHHKYVEAKAQGDVPGATELLANALSIAESKGKDIDNWYSEIKTLVLQ